jgi:hypothetical protein
MKYLIHQLLLLIVLPISISSSENNEIISTTSFNTQVTLDGATLTADIQVGDTGSTAAEYFLQMHEDRFEAEGKDALIRLQEALTAHMNKQIIIKNAAAESKAQAEARAGKEKKRAEELVKAQQVAAETQKEL